MRPKLLALLLCGLGTLVARSSEKPNIVLIYTDDVGYGDIGCYGATRVSTPNIDQLAATGLRFTDAHATDATCTPSRYSLLTGEYAWREKGTGIAPGDAPALIKPGRVTLPSLLQKAGYTTAAIGKWHLGLGEGAPDWNGELKPGPLEIGFDTCFIMPATGDRTPCVFVRDHRVVGFDPKDPIEVSFKHRVGDEPTGREHPELLRMLPSHEHDQTIVNGVSRMGYMSGGKAARWVDEDIADTLTREATSFIEKNRDHPFFLYLATHDIHVPRMPNARFVGRTPMGPRGDVIAELDWIVGQVSGTIARLGLTQNTLIIFTSDNGPVIDDGYQDQAAEKLGDHKPAGPWRGGKYSIFEGGTRVPMIVCWPGHVKSGVTRAMFTQIDLGASFAALTGESLAHEDLPDSIGFLPTLLGLSDTGHSEFVEHAGALGLRSEQWKFVAPSRGPAINRKTHTELGNLPAPQLYDVSVDPGETENLAAAHPDLVARLAARLEAIRAAGRSRP